MGASFPSTPTVQFGPKVFTLDPATPSSLSIRVPLDQAARWRALLRNVGPAAVTGLTIAESPLARFDAAGFDPTNPTAYGPATNLAAAPAALVATTGKYDLQPPTGVPDCATSLLLVFAVAALTQVEITLGGV